jgi:TonB family protein
MVVTLNVLGGLVLSVSAIAAGQGGQGTGAPPRGAAPSEPSGRFAAPAPVLVPVTKIDLAYPDKAKRAGVQGDVSLDVIILAGGTVKSIMIHKSLDTVFGLDQAAIAAVRQWQYPPLTDGRAARPPQRVVIPFRLPDASPALVSTAPAEEFGKGAYHLAPSDSPVVPPRIKRAVPPVYTTAGFRAKIVGRVGVEAVVLPDGTVGQARVVKSLDKTTGLDDQALGAAREWTFEPGTLEGKPVPVIVNLVIDFTLR